MKATFKTIALSFVLILAASTAAFAQKMAAKTTLEVSITVVDDKGEAIPFADVTVGEGLAHLRADANGMLAFSCSSRDLITVSKDGYSKAVIPSVVLVDSDSVVLNPDILFAGESDNVYLPYTVTKKRYGLGSAITISGEELARYSSSDIRNALTAVLPGVEVVEHYGQVGMTPMEHTGQYGASTAVSVNSRGRQLMYMVDDVPVNIDETPISPEQIESVTIVRDVLDKTLYGATAADGIVYIRTKRGAYNERYLDVAYEGGVNVVDRMAQFVNAKTYARLNNVARYNSGLTPLYTAEDVLAYGNDDPDDKLHPSVDFSKMMLKNVMYYNRASVSSAGGNDIVRYQMFLGYNGQDDIYSIGPKADYNNINLSGKIDLKLNRFVKVDFGVISSLGIRRSANYGYSANYSSEDASSNTTLGVFEFPEVIAHLTTIPQLAFPIYADNSEELESPYYAVSSQYTQNPIANILENGSYTETSRKALFNVGLDVDFSFLLPGLKSYTYAAYDGTNLVRLGTAEDYAAYIITTATDIDGNKIIVPQQSGSHKVVSMSKKAKLMDYFSSRFYLMEKLSYEKTFGDHDLRLGADYMITKRSQKFITEHRREMNVGLNAAYAYKGRYLAQLAVNTHGTYSLLNSWSCSPSIGLGWILSEEDFLSGVSGIDYLKIRAQGGLLHYDSLTSANRDVDNYSWNNSGQKFGPYTTNQWFGSDQGSSTNRTYASMLGNPNLRLERRWEATVGADLTAFSRRLDFSASYWYSFYDGTLSAISNVLPLVAGTSTGSLYMNYNQTQRQGMDVNLSWSDKIGDFSYSVSGWASTLFSKVKRIDELNYDEEYRSKVGKSATAIWGLRYVGQFATAEEANASGQLFDESLAQGDFKYMDMNGDGVVDDTDACVIGDSTPKLTFGLNFAIAYKGFDLSISATGRAFYDAQLTNSYYWNGWGDSNYSLYTLQHVNDATAPRLTYNKVNNNYKLSDYWLVDGSFLKIQSLELGYALPVAKLHMGPVRGARVFVRGNNLLTISKIKDLDPEALSAGLTNYPLMKTFVGGLKITF